MTGRKITCCIRDSNGRKCHFCCEKSCRDKHVFVLTKHVFCHDKSMLVLTKRLLQQTFFATNIILSRQKVLPWQAYFCCDKTCAVCHNKTSFVVTKVCLSWPNLCHDKPVFVATKYTNIVLLRRKFCWSKHTFVMTKDVFCHDKHVFVATTKNTLVASKIILVAAATNDIESRIMSVLCLAFQSDALPTKLSPLLYSCAVDSVLSNSLCLFSQQLWCCTMLFWLGRVFYHCVFDLLPKTANALNIYRMIQVIQLKIAENVDFVQRFF